jgi:hypothetical protein
MRVLVHGRIGIRARVAIVRRDVDETRPGAGLFGGRQQPSISAAAAPCGAAQKIAQVGSFVTSAVTSASELKRVSGYALARWLNALATGSPGWLSERMAASSRSGCPAISRSSSPDT